MFGEDFDTLNPTFQDLGAFIETDETPEGWDDGYEDDGYDGFDDDFPMSLEYDEGDNDMYADGDGFYTNDPGDW